MIRVCTFALLVAGVAAAQGGKSARPELLEEAVGHYRAQRPAEAVRLFREYLAVAPDRADVRVYLGAALLNLNQPAAALEEARRAIAADPKHGKAYVLAGRIYAGQREWDIAQQFYERAIKLDRADRDAWYFSGRAFYEEGLFEKSIEALLQAGSEGRVFENLGLAYEAIGRHQEAEAAYKRAVELSKRAYRPHLAYGVFLHKQSRLSESLPLLREAARLDPNSIEVRFELARALYQADKYQEAIGVLTVDIPPNECRVRNLRGRILLGLGKSREAMREFEDFQACLRANPENQP